MKRLAILSLCGLAAVLGGQAQAATLAFSGARSNVDSPGASAARCGGRTTISIRNSATSTSTGTSNFGNFNPTLSHCIQLPLVSPAPYDLGVFNFDFASGDSLFGTYNGLLTATLTPGVFDILQDHLIAGGTGMFLGASGTFQSTGLITFGRNQPPSAQQTFQGLINAPAIPEPASWMMMIAGFGLIGGALRRRAPVLSYA